MRFAAPWVPVCVSVSCDATLVCVRCMVRRMLRLYNNQLSGSIPPEIGRLVALR